jgi:hypothetical protein
MSEVSIQTLSPQRVVSAALRRLNQEQIEDAVACFTTDFRYKDHGIGVEFTDKARLTEFFRKTRERLTPRSLRVTRILRDIQGWGYGQFTE